MTKDEAIRILEWLATKRLEGDFKSMVWFGGNPNFPSGFVTQEDEIALAQQVLKEGLVEPLLSNQPLTANQVELGKTIAAKHGLAKED